VIMFLFRQTRRAYLGIGIQWFYTDFLVYCW
jgi:hypothetical protein